MYEKITIKEYMSRENVSRTTVENRIKKGELETVKEGNRRYIKLQNPQVSQGKAKNEDIKQHTYIKQLLSTIKEQKKELKKLKKELKKEIKYSRNEISKLTQKNEELTRMLYKEKDETIKVLKQFIGEMKLLMSPEKKEDIIDVTDNKKKKKKNKHKKHK